MQFEKHKVKVWQHFPGFLARGKSTEIFPHVSKSPELVCYVSLVVTFGKTGFNIDDPPERQLLVTSTASPFSGKAISGADGGRLEPGEAMIVANFVTVAKPPMTILTVPPNAVSFCRGGTFVNTSAIAQMASATILRVRQQFVLAEKVPSPLEVETFNTNIVRAEISRFEIVVVTYERIEDLKYKIRSLQSLFHFQHYRIPPHSHQFCVMRSYFSFTFEIGCFIPVLSKDLFSMCLATRVQLISIVIVRHKAVIKRRLVHGNS